MHSNQGIVSLLESFWPKNKAKGLLAQTVFHSEINKGLFGSEGSEKVLSGCWLLAPKNPEFYKFRFCFFVHPEIIKTADFRNDPKEILGNRYRPFYAIAEYMNNAGIGVVYAVTLTDNGELPVKEIKQKKFDSLKWKFFIFENGGFSSRDPLEFFDRWEGTRGRATNGGNWTPETKSKIQKLDKETLTEMALTELIYWGFIKSTLKKPVNDPYDVDAFMISISQKNIFPMEIKEKFPGENNHEKFFGIDAGRVMMLLRLCIPNDSNAVYLIRELDEKGKFIGWKYIALSDIIMTSGWNLQAGGPGMGGQQTQTIKLPYEYFKEFNTQEITEENLKALGNLPKDVKSIAKQFSQELEKKFG